MNPADLALIAFGVLALAIAAIVAAELASARRQLAAAHAAAETVRRQLNGAQLGLWCIDFERHVTRSSEIILAICGLGPERELMPNEDFIAMIHPEDRPGMLAKFGDARTQRTQFDHEYRIVRPDGTIRWVLTRCQFDADVESPPSRAVGITMDVTARKEAEQAHAKVEARLHRAMEEFESILNLAPVGIMVARHPDCAKVTSNAYMERLFGVARGTNLSASAPDVPRLGFTLRRNGKALRPEEMPLQRAASHGEQTLNEFMDLEMPDGRCLEVIVSAVPLLDNAGKPRGAIGTTQDVTWLRRMAVALQSSEERFRVAQDSSLVAFTILKAVRAPDGAIVDFEWEYANRAAASILRRSVDQLIGSRLLAELPGNRESSELFASYVRVVETGVPRTLQLDYEADGIKGTFLNAASKLGDSVAVWFMDLTERQRLVEELQAREASLREADRQKDEFLATLAHELRNPMAPIRYAAALIRPEVPAATLQQARQMIERQSAHMSRLLEDLLDMSRITRNVIELRREVLDIRRIVDEAVEGIRAAASAERHQLTVTLPAASVLVNGDPLRLGQIVGNLLHNAVKYTPPGGRIGVEVETREHVVCISVSDTGVGLSTDMLPRAFTLFSQLHPSMRAAKGGLGIGLAVSKRLVELHGGNIEARSEGLGLGTEFIVRLPAATPVAGPGTSTGTKVVTLFRNAPRVLIVDDNQDAADSLSMLLRAEGLQVHVAYKGRDAVALAKSIVPDVVLLDLGLPDIHGEQVARELREQPWAKSMRLVAVTGWGQESDRARTRRAGFDLHLVKPVDPDELLGIISQGAERSRAG